MAIDKQLWRDLRGIAAHLDALADDNEGDEPLHNLLRAAADNLVAARILMQRRADA